MLEMTWQHCSEVFEADQKKILRCKRVPSDWTLFLREEINSQLTTTEISLEYD